MRRASLSRRSQEPAQGSYVRSRSEERKVGGEFVGGDFGITQDKVEGDLMRGQFTEDTDGFEYNAGAPTKAEDHLHDLGFSPKESHAAGPADRITRRAMSDPFDTPLTDQEMDEIFQAASQEPQDDKNNKQQQKTASVHNEPYPTLPRFPVAATRDKNCWSEPPIHIYSVRGISYLKDKKKVPSPDYLLRTRGFDLFLFEEHVEIKDRINQILNGNLRALPTLAINFQFPWGSMILYYEIPYHLSRYIGQSNGMMDVKLDQSLESPAERVLANWLQGDTPYKNERLKLIPYVAEGPWVVRNMVTGRPAIIGKKLPVKYEAFVEQDGHVQPLLFCTLDIGNSSAAAKRIVSVCRRYMSALTVDIGFVLQGDTTEELPEQMLGAIRVHGPDPLKACRL